MKIIKMIDTEKLTLRKLPTGSVFSFVHEGDLPEAPVYVLNIDKGMFFSVKTGESDPTREFLDYEVTAYDATLTLREITTTIERSV